MSIRPFLDRLFETYHREEFLSSDPLEFPRRFRDPWDQEAVALVAALLAYGNVKQIRRSVDDLLQRIQKGGLGPAQFVRSLSGPDGHARARQALSGFVHRFNRGDDLLLLYELLGRSWVEYGSLGAHLVRSLEPEASDFSTALSALIRDWREWAGARSTPSFSHLLTSPEDGSCCKRWCMLLRWMGRQDPAGGLDLGLWSKDGALRATFPPGRWLKSSQLVIPLDTHVGRLSHYLGLRKRRTLDWRAACEVTEALRACDPLDPVRYDFALARLGILDRCQRMFQRDVCDRCELLPACRFAKKRIRMGQEWNRSARNVQGSFSS
ncbi:MAG: TIGR02757 family protein [Oligoflexia bacterium]|nr:TIGR02757 family protein [Oligoflexia bacterium]